MRSVLFVLLLSGCGPASAFESGAQSVQLASAADLQHTLETLPTCGPDAQPVQLRAVKYICTKRHCDTACCNMCSWKLATGPGPGGTLVGAAFLQLPGDAKDCEIEAWNALLSTVTLDNAQACIGAP